MMSICSEWKMNDNLQNYSITCYRTEEEKVLLVTTNYDEQRAN